MNQRPPYRLLVITLLMLTSISITSSAEEVPERKDIAEKYKWDLTDMYSDASAWQADKARFMAMLPGIARFKGTLGESGSQLLEAIEEIQRVEAIIANLYVYAGLKSYEDTRISENGEIGRAHV